MGCKILKEEFYCRLQIREFCERGNELYDQLKTTELLKGDFVLCTLCANVIVLEGYVRLDTDYRI